MNFEQERRYARQIMLTDVGAEGQQKLLAARVLIVGAGGLGSTLITYLAAAGIGHLGIIDPDRVELSNLPRQMIHETGDIGRLKVESAADRVHELNPDVDVITNPFALTLENAAAIIADYDIVADGCDNFASRFVANQVCVTLKKPLVSAALAGFDGQVMTVAPHLVPGSACYQCFVAPTARDANNCTASGVVGPLAGLIGSAQALEIIRLILGFPALIGRIALYEGRTASQRIIELTRDPACAVCGKAAQE